MHFVCAPKQSKNDSDNYKGLRIGNLRLYAALTWRDFRFIVISGFYPFLASFVNQRTLIVFPNNQQNDSDNNRGLRTGNLRHGAFTWRHFRFIVIGGFYPFLANIANQRTLLARHNN